MDVIALIGRILFAVVFIGSGALHLTQTPTLAGYATSKGVPLAKVATLASGVVMLVSVVLMVLNATLMVCWIVL